jgi:NTE family protein
MRLADLDLKLVLGGGGALGAYQGGVYEALDEAGLRPGHVCGASIGALNAALIAGNEPGLRVDRLRRYWELVAEPVALPVGPALADATLRRIHGLTASLRARLLGRPGLYAPQFLDALSPVPALRSPGLYNFGPAMETLPRLADFGLPGREGAARLTVVATDLATGEPVLFDSGERPVEPRHVAASASIIPDFAPAEVDGRLLCDAGFSANLPLRPAITPGGTRPTLCVAVDLIPSEAARPRWSLEGMIERKQDFHFASQTRAVIDGLAAEVELAALRAGGPAAAAPVALAHLVYRGSEGAGSQKLFDYSRASIEERWRRGLEDGRAMVASLLEAPEPEGGRLTVLRYPDATGGGAEVEAAREAA